MHENIGTPNWKKRLSLDYNLKIHQWTSVTLVMKPILQEYSSVIRLLILCPSERIKLEKASLLHNVPDRDASSLRGDRRQSSRISIERSSLELYYQTDMDSFSRVWARTLKKTFWRKKTIITKYYLRYLVRRVGRGCKSELCPSIFGQTHCIKYLNAWGFTVCPHWTR